jgi:hypothetical protein
MVTSDVTHRLQWLHCRLREIVFLKIGALTEETVEIKQILQCSSVAQPNDIIPLINLILVCSETNN